jgi:hypothetical protein
MVVFAAMPLGMAVAHRSSAAFLVLSALCSLGALAVEGKVRPMLRQAFSALTSPLGAAVLAFFGWCLVSIGWSEFKLVSLHAFGEFWLSAAAAFVVAMTLGRRIPPKGFWLLTGAMVLACLMMVIELRSGLVLRRAIGMRADSFIFNRPVLTLLVLTPPLAAWYLGLRRYGWAYVLAILLLVSGTALESESDAAVLGLIIVCLAFPVAWFAPRFTRVSWAIALGGVMIAAPYMGLIGERLITPSMHEVMASGHSRERIDLWSSFGSAVREQPLLGAGFGVSPRMAETAVARKVPAERRPMLAIGHPHNVALQIWAELGAVGIVLALMVVLLMLQAVSRQPPLTRSATFTLIAGAAPVAFVGHGAWQGWWAASLGAAIIWMLAANRIQSEITP